MWRPLLVGMGVGLWVSPQEEASLAWPHRTHPHPLAGLFAPPGGVGGGD